ncbi:MAG: hypothetical protein NUV45_06410 [Tepidanaerobacteraceae bacterium]|jgi:hypothetical protein|nr:hypothetical protein [Tepidanaerobacteraceae bacterium]
MMALENPRELARQDHIKSVQKLLRRIRKDSQGLDIPTLQQLEADLHYLITHKYNSD